VTEKKVEINEKSGAKKVLEQRRSNRSSSSRRLRATRPRRPAAAPAEDPKAKKKPAPAEKAK
jgi:hypothetical protein